MLCDICKKENSIVYVTSRYGNICIKCMSKKRNNGEIQLQRYKDKLKMYKKYGIIDEDLEKKIKCIEQIQQ